MSSISTKAPPGVLFMGLALLLGGCGTSETSADSAIGSQTDPVKIIINFPPPKKGGGGGGGQSAGAIITSAQKVLFFGENCAGGVNKQTLSLQNTGTVNLKIRELSLSNDTFALDAPPTLPATIKPGDTLDLSVRFTAPDTVDQAAALEGTLTVSSNAGNQKTLNVPLRGIVSPETLTLSRRQLDFGEQLVGNAASHHLILRNVGACSTTVSGFDARGNQASGVAVTGLPTAPLLPGHSRTVNVTLLCQNDGDVNVNLSFLGTAGRSLTTANLIGLCFSP